MSIRLRVLLAFILLASGGVVALARVVARDLWPYTQRATEESLVETANVLAAIVEAQSTGEGLGVDDLRRALASAQGRLLQAHIYELRKDTVDLRVYVTDKRGIVVFDSAGGRAEGEDYSQWNDVRLTLAGGYGARATRFDPANPFSSVLYVAAPIRRSGGLAGVLSVGKPVRGLELMVDTMRQKVLLAGLVLIGASAVVALGLALWITQPIKRLTDYALTIGAGERAALPRLQTREIATLGQAMESMRQALEGKRYVEDYVRSLTHEIKAPLSAIRAASELLVEPMAPADRTRFLANIHSETQRLQTLVDRMLELSSLETRQRIERPETFALCDVVGEVQESVMPLAAQKHLTQRSAVALGISVTGDRLLIRQALANLVHNAVAATPEGGTITVSAETGASHVRVVVLDTGPGIPPFALPRVFERFYSVPVGAAGNKGTGLGLPFVREVAHLHGGEATIENRPEGGVRATMTLSLA